MDIAAAAEAYLEGHAAAAFVAIRVVDYASIALSLAGIVVSSVGGLDGVGDLRAARTLPRGSLDRLAGTIVADIGISAAVGGLILHVALLSLGYIGATAPMPRPGRFMFALLYGLVFVVLQLASVACQRRVLLKRGELRELSRRMLSKEAP